MVLVWRELSEGTIPPPLTRMQGATCKLAPWSGNHHSATPRCRKLPWDLQAVSAESLDKGALRPYKWLTNCNLCNISMCGARVFPDVSGCLSILPLKTDDHGTYASGFENLEDHTGLGTLAHLEQCMVCGMHEIDIHGRSTGTGGKRAPVSERDLHPVRGGRCQGRGVTRGMLWMPARQ